ncbi:MAG: sulfite exporter TauE/SafE family protein [Elusimicrobia bacterium]|nr:sulfite exporter TauE/SafE family protein [Elusimicrobiota bacterium]
MGLTSFAVFLVATAYAAVGHGGASGYLAVLALLGYAPAQTAPSALALNILVSATAFIAYRRAGHFEPSLFWPFALASVPAAFLGGMLRVPPRTHSWLLSAALVFAALRLAMTDGPRENAGFPRRLPLRLTLPVGGAIGLLSGIVGVGGGIFLSPLMIIARWADANRTAAAAAGFILVNSIAGLCGHWSRHRIDAEGLWPLALAAFLGGLIGSHAGSRRLGEAVLRRLLAATLVAAAFKLILTGPA